MELDSVFGRTAFAALTVIGFFCAGAPPVPGQTANQNPAAQGGAHAASKTAHSTHSGKHVAQAKAEPVAAPTPPPIPKPDWPVNAQARPASVIWNGSNLSIAATNSSLQQILNEVSTATGLKVDGQSGDQRIFGSYGPAPARDVLSQLLQGSGYNVLMIGDRGEGTPRELVLTAKTQSAGSSSRAGAQANSNSDDEVQEDPEPPEQSEPPQRRPGLPVQPSGPQGRFPPDMQQRQQQIEQQQQQQLQQQQQPQPNPQPPTPNN